LRVAVPCPQLLGRAKIHDCPGSSTFDANGELVKLVLAEVDITTPILGEVAREGVPILAITEAKGACQGIKRIEGYDAARLGGPQGRWTYGKQRNGAKLHVTPPVAGAAAVRPTLLSSLASLNRAPLDPHARRL